jgi:RHS repeat-associated protein
MHGLAVGARGELVIDGLAWLGARAYDPATRSFLSPDPLPGLPGHPWTNHPYQYAANDPVGWADPTGLRPVTDAELAALREGWHEGTWDHHGGDVANVTDVADRGAVPGAAVVGALGIGPADSPMLAGALASAGLAAGIRQAIDGEVDWASVGVDMVTGVHGMTSVAAMSPLVHEATVGIVASTIGGLTARAVAGHDPFDPTGLAADVLGGGVSPVAGGDIGGRNPGLQAATAAIE